jgi:hypothetical protein
MSAELERCSRQRRGLALHSRTLNTGLRPTERNATGEPRALFRSDGDEQVNTSNKL